MLRRRLVPIVTLALALPLVVGCSAGRGSTSDEGGGASGDGHGVDGAVALDIAEPSGGCDGCELSDLGSPDGGSSEGGDTTGGGDAAQGGHTTPPTNTAAPSVVTVGALDRFILRGTIVTPDVVLEGEVLVVGATIACVDTSCSGHSGAAGATVIESNGTIFPGLIDTHNHVLFDVFNADDWPLTHTYDYHEEWADAPAYEAMRDALDYLITTADSNLKCEVLKYGEIKALMGGATSIVGQPKGTPQKCFASLARSLDGQFNDLPPIAEPPFEPPTPCTAAASSDHIQTSFNPKVTADYAQGVLENFASCKTWAWHVHAGEAVWDFPEALGEFQTLIERGLDVHQTVIVHGIAFGTPEFQHMADRGMKLIWSPRCNVALHGQTARLDLLKTLDGPPPTVAIGADWSLNGSTNLLDELAFASAHNQAEFNGAFSAHDLVDMVTINGARVLSMQKQIGSIEVGKMADLIIVSKTSADPYEALTTARSTDIAMTMVGGVILYGNPSLTDAMALPDCAPIDVCGQSRRLCVAEPSTADLLGQTLQDITGALTGALSAYDALNGTQYLPLAPFVTCP